MTPQQILENHAIGQAVFNKLFALNSKQLRIKLKEIIDLDLINDYLLNEGYVKKITLNDEPYQILIQFHDELSIDAFGIVFNGEHERFSKTLINFCSKNFKLD